MSASCRIGVDVGGTFTDLVLAESDGSVRVVKVPSVPGEPAAGVMQALEQLGRDLGEDLREVLGRCALFVHGSTIATNTVLERKGATVGLIGTKGFRDTLEIRRGIRVNPWDHRTPYAPVLVPRFLRMTVAGRLDRDGQELEALDVEEVLSAKQAFQRNGVDSIAVCLFNSYANPAHEQACAQVLQADGQPVEWLSLSHEIVPLLGEYERTATTVLNAYVAPRTVGYLTALDGRLRALGLPQPMLLIQNNGGSVSVGQVSNKPATLLLSGPAAGVGALEIARDALAVDNLLSLEIGGTSADVMLMQEGQVPVSEQLSVGGYDTALASVEIHTIGAGGGTIATVDAAGLLQVGPHGAGADPGPAAYGNGGVEATVTDALLVLGRLRPGTYANGSVTLDIDKATQAIEAQVANPLGLSAPDAAAGVLALLEQHLLQAVEQVTLERGLDPSGFTLVPAGGAGPMHGASVGRRLGCTRLYVPRMSGAFCAIGMLQVDVRHDLRRPLFAPLDEAVDLSVGSAFEALETEATQLLEAAGFGPSTSRLRREMDLRYEGQQWTIRVSVTATDTLEQIRRRFEQAHERRYRHIQPDGLVELTALHLIAYGVIDKFSPTKQDVTDSVEVRPSDIRRTYCDAQHGWVDAGVFSGAQLPAGAVVQGPAIIEELTTTIFIGPRDRLIVDGFQNYVVELPREREDRHE
ncbi:MAG: hydantoinase/oxoprolinase family protein [Chromatiales bacterium]|nr:hydantoinase/oxoprolinase family protein [Chromatiales bacterium]